LYVAVESEAAVADIDGHVVAVPGLDGLALRQLARCLLGVAVQDADDGAVGRCPDLCAEERERRDVGRITGVKLPRWSELDEVDGEPLGDVDNATNGECGAAVCGDGVAAPVAYDPAVALKGRRDLDGLLSETVTGTRRARLRLRRAADLLEQRGGGRSEVGGVGDVRVAAALLVAAGDGDDVQVAAAASVRVAPGVAVGVRVRSQPWAAAGAVVAAMGVQLELGGETAW
jgi:hypothetical protein